MVVIGKMSKGIASLEILQSVSDAMTGLVDKVGPSVVRVRSGRGFGSGVVWSEDGYVLTCSHVVGRASRVEIGFGRGQSLEANVVGHDPYSDMALLKVERNGLKPVELGDSEEIKVGQLVFAFANPFGRRPSTTSGIVTTAKTALGWGRGFMEDMIVTDAPLNPGYSGGPLVDASGRMIGLSVAYVNSRGIAIPINTAREMVDSIIREGRIRRAHLGILSDTISFPKDIANQAKIEQEEGLMILEVEPDSPAKKAGLAVGDIVVRFNKAPITSHHDLYRMLTKDAIGNPVEIDILRAEKLVKLTITPSEDEPS
jgi:S1-C subfamily serine protease